MKKPLLSVIIPTYNEEKDIEECLRTLFNQSYKKIEIIIVDDGSKDNTLNLIENFSKEKKIIIKILKQEHLGPGAARNLGVKESKGEILIFVDADMSFPEDFLEKLTKPIIDGKTIGTCREMEIVKNVNNIWSRCWGKIRISKENANKQKAFRAILKDKFLEMGGFDSRYGYADDQTFWFKHKKRPIIANGAVCYHKNPETLRGVYNQSKWIGASIDNFWLNDKILRYISPILLVLMSPIIISLLTLKKCYENKEWSIIIYMFIFMTIRYFGTIHGVINRIFFDKNFR